MYNIIVGSLFCYIIESIFWVVGVFLTKC